MLVKNKLKFTSRGGFVALKYDKTSKVAMKRLKLAHDSDKAKIRAYFFQKENEFFRKNIRGQKVLVAGSGLGHDSFELANYNKEVVGVDILENLINASQRSADKLSLPNLKFIRGDFTHTPFKNKSFNSAVLNIGTIGNFDDKARVIKGLLSAAHTVYIDFYPPNAHGLKTRKKMYEEEGWVNVRIQGNSIVSDDGLESGGIPKEEITRIVNSIGAKVTYHNLCDFALMAKIT